ncbi:unnamed protein product [Chrysodeixis includens]|uniref:Uncharacterized protein n=1 Tax=Chrysodeixis includens TaxID=689277 RepID=A0A9N8L5Y7_CHRIL|nr:unnamed protein product [Chrysodeixis includens]
MTHTHQRFCGKAARPRSLAARAQRDVSPGRRAGPGPRPRPAAPLYSPGYSALGNRTSLTTCARVLHSRRYFAPQRRFGVYWRPKRCECPPQPALPAGPTPLRHT